MKITTKSQIEKRQARTEAAILLMLMLQRPAPITPNPMLPAGLVINSDILILELHCSWQYLLIVIHLGCQQRKLQNNAYLVVIHC